MIGGGVAPLGGMVRVGAGIASSATAISSPDGVYPLRNSAVSLSTRKAWRVLRGTKMKSPALPLRISSPTRKVISPLVM